MIYALCPKHTEAARTRIDAACEHCRDRDIDWWEAWFDRETKRTDEQRRECCNAYCEANPDYAAGIDASVRRPLQRNSTDPEAKWTT